MGRKVHTYIFPEKDIDALNECLVHKIHNGWWKDKTSFRDKLVAGWTRRDLETFYGISPYEYAEVVTFLRNSDSRNLSLGSINDNEKLHLLSSQI